MIALDTNILIYACDKADVARQQVAMDVVSRVDDGLLLWQVVCRNSQAGGRRASKALQLKSSVVI
jgi:predicted nucleic acid-binding protein